MLLARKVISKAVAELRNLAPHAACGSARPLSMLGWKRKDIERDSRMTYLLFEIWI